MVQYLFINPKQRGVSLYVLTCFGWLPNLPCLSVVVLLEANQPFLHGH